MSVESVRSQIVNSLCAEIIHSHSNVFYSVFVSLLTDADEITPNMSFRDFQKL